MVELTNFVRESDEIRRIMKKTLGEQYEPAMAKTAMQIIDFQYKHGIESSLLAAFELCKHMSEKDWPIDRIRAASIWWECNKVYFFNSLYNLLDNE